VQPVQYVSLHSMATRYVCPSQSVLLLQVEQAGRHRVLVSQLQRGWAVRGPVTRRRASLHQQTTRAYLR